MTDVFKKIDDMLKEKKDDYDDMYRIFKKGGDKQLAYTTHEILKVIRSIRQMIGEMEKEYNDGWIPCSERLPENSYIHEVTAQFVDGKCYTEFAYYDLSREEWWKHDDDGLVNVIAWKKPSAPYKPKGENNAEIKP